VPASRYHTSDCCPVSLSAIRSPCVEQEICTTSPERRERTVLAAVLGRSRIATAQSRPPQLEWTVKEVGALGAGAGAMVVVISARGAVDVEASLLAVGATSGLDFAPSLRPMAATTPTAATPSRTTIAAKTRTRLRDRPAAGISPKTSAAAGATLEARWVRSSASVRNAGDLSTPNAAFSNATIRSPASTRVAGVVESPVRVGESDVTSDGKSHSVSGSLSSESCPESDPVAIGTKWYSLDFSEGSLVVEAFVGALGERGLELVEERDVVLQVGDEEIGEVTRHPVPDHNAERGEVLAVLGEGVCGD
jgi:hypothetical protein